MIESNVAGQARWRSAFMDNYGTPALTLVRGDGPWVWDADGNRYLDLVGGIAVNLLGHAHPAIVAAVSEQIGVLGHTSNLQSNPVAVELAEALLDVTGFAGNGRVFLCNSGTEALEAAFKITRRTGRHQVVACVGAFHGRTMGALALTGQPAKRAPFDPLVPGVTHVPFGDVAALAAAVTDQTAAVFVEPVLGEGGVLPAPSGYLAAAREITSAAGALLVVDEVQTGLGRLGSWFGFQQAGITPDVITLAKGLGGGLPLGAVVGVGAAGDLLLPGQHGSTFGGNPVCCAAGLAVLRTIAADRLAEHAAVIGKAIAHGVGELRHPLVSGVRGCGLLLGITLRRPVAARVAQAAQHAGYLVNPVQPDVLRLAPPLIIEDQHVHDFVAALPAALDAVED